MAVQRLGPKSVARPAAAGLSYGAAVGQNAGMPQTPRAEGAETARRALRVLEIIAGSSESVMLDEVVRRTGFNKSTAYRLIRVLQEESYLEHADGGGYIGGSRLFALAASALPNGDTYRDYLPLLEQLASEAGETCTLHRRVGDRAVLVLGAENTSHPLRRVWTAGEVTRLTRGSAALAILSKLPDDVVEEILSSEPSDEVTRVRRDLGRARRSGYVLSFGVNHPGIAGIATSLPDTPMSVSVSGPEQRWTEKRMLEFAPRLLDSTRGFQGSLT